MAVMVGRIGVGLVAALGLAGCLTPSGTTCGDDFVCGAGEVCAPTGGGCVDPAQVEACAGLAEGEACTLPGIGDGQCRDEVCVVTGCGDGVVDSGEACDDGAANGPDAPCTLECKRPTCGDGAVQGDEQCDDGAANGDDRSCLPTCVVATCGDGRVWASHEACDAGAANADTAACTSGCAVATCGDAVVWTDVELCDDGNAASGDGCRADCRKVEACGDALADDGEACDDGNTNPVDGCDACVATAWQADALVRGTGEFASLSLSLNFARGIAVDRDDRLYVADTNNSRVLRVEPDGTARVIMGGGSAGAADGLLGTDASASYVQGVAVDGLGDVYAAVTGENKIVRLDHATQRLTVIAGGGPGGDGGPAHDAAVQGPTGVAVDGLGNVYIAEHAMHRVRRVDRATGIISTVAGTGAAGFAGDGEPASAAMLNSPNTVALDAHGDLFIADWNNSRVRRVDADTGVITTVAGNGGAGGTGDGGPATAAGLGGAPAVTVSPTGDLYIAEAINRVRRVDGVTGVISTVAGTGTYGFAGDGGPASAAWFFFTIGVALAPDGDVLILDSYNQRVRRVDADTQVIDTVIGDGGVASVGDGGSARAATLSGPQGLVVEPSGAIVIADTGDNRVRRVTTDGLIELVAGTGVPGTAGVGGPATAAQLTSPADVALADDGTLYVLDGGNVARLSRIDAATGTLTVLASNLNGAVGIGLDLAGDVLVAAPQGTLNLIRVDHLTGAVSVVADADGGRLISPADIVVAPDGGIYFSDHQAHRVMRIPPGGGALERIAGITDSGGYSGDGGAATAARLTKPTGLALAADGALLISDQDNFRIRRVDPGSGIITTVVGGGMTIGDHLPATSVLLGGPGRVAVDPGTGDLLLSERAYQRVYRVTADGVLRVVAGQVEPRGMGPLGQATLGNPQALVLAAPMDLVAGGSTGTVQALRGDRVDVVAGRSWGWPSGDRARLRGFGFGSVDGVAYDPVGDRLFVAETSSHRIQQVTWTDRDDLETWHMAPLVGTGSAGFADGPLASAALSAPSGLVLDATATQLYVADAGNHVVRVIDLATNTITTVAGTPQTRGYFGDGLTATDALLYAPTALALAPDGDVFIADTGNHRLRRVAAGSGVITTVLGDGTAASSGEGAPAWTFPVDAPRGLAVDALGNLYATSSTTVALLPADAAGIVDGSGAVQRIFGAPPRDAFPASASRCLTGVAVVDLATVQVVDACAGMLIELWRQPVP